MTAQPVEASMFSGEIHPYAAAFPMLPDDDLDALGADIKANGQRILCVLDQNGRLLDGRNRIAACDRVGVKPGFEMVTVTEDEAVALIVTANMQRRDLTQDQKAHLAVAAQYTNRIKQVDLANIAGVRQPKIAEAVIVRRFAPQSSDAVIAGDLTHQRALATARGIKDDLAEREQRRRTLDAEAPDLNWLTPDEAWAAYLERTRKDREAAEAAEEARRKFNADLRFAIHCLAPLAAHELRREQVAQDLDRDPTGLGVTDELCADALAAIELIRATLKEGAQK